MNNLIIPAVQKIVENAFSTFNKSQDIKENILKEVSQSINEVIDAQKNIIVAEAAGNWMQRSWRPLVMLSFAFIVVYSYFIQPAFFPDSVNIRAELPADFWQLLNIGLGGYVIGRSLEKIAENVKMKK